MNLDNSCSMEETSLEVVDRMSMEYRVLMAYAQRRLSASKCRQLLENEIKCPEGSYLQRQDMNAREALSSEDQQQPSKKSQKKKKRKEKKKKSKWRRLLFPSCLKAQSGEEPRQPLSFRFEGPNSDVLMLHGGVGSSKPIIPQGAQDDSSITLVADRLAEIVDNSRFVEQRGLKTLVPAISLEADAGQASQSISEEDGKDNAENIIEAIVALLRHSGDELEKKMQKDKTLSQCVSELTSYVSFRRVTDQFLEEAPIRSTMDNVEVCKIAYAVEVTAKLAALAKHPMNTMLGFGTRYLKETFGPWIYSQGGWEKALGIPDHKEVE